jgi:peptide-methionine (R)-S-oxide reductase
MKRLFHWIPSFLLVCIFYTSCTAQDNKPSKSSNPKMVSQTNHKEISDKHSFELQKSDSEWQKTLDPEQYRILREKGTERPFTSELEDNYDGGTYTCAGCGSELFSSNGKFDSGCGWPSFYEALDQTKIVTKTDHTFGMTRTEIMCAKCGGHLGHVFDDGPKDKTGLRYCVNGKSLNFKK